MSGTAQFAITDFMAKLDGLGSYAKRNRFTVEIIPPSTLVTSVPVASIEFLISAVSLPGRSFGATTYRSGGKFGLEVPYEVTEEPVSLTFLGTNDWTARKFWHDWHEHIQANGSWNMRYYKDFIGTVSISVYSEDSQTAGTPTHKVVLHKCWPKTIGAIELGWESGELVDFTIDIAYSWWTDGGGSGGSPSVTAPTVSPSDAIVRSSTTRTSTSSSHSATISGPGGAELAALLGN